MGNTSGKSHHRTKGLTVSSSSRVTRWDRPGLPAPPGKPILIPGTEDTQPDVVGIRWERSPSNGGSAIVGYLVEHRRLGSPHWLRSAPVLCTFPELTLSGLEPGWRYQFRVRAQNALGFSEPSEISDPLTVTLQRATASPPQFEQELKDTLALENEHTEFVVRFSGTPLPKISWFKDGFEIFSSRRTRIITENGRSVLLIHQTALNDEGEIKCTATNRAGHIATKARLILEAPPRIRLPRQYEDGLLFEQGESIRLKVSLAGRPAPFVQWYHDGEDIPQDGRRVIETMEGESTLKIPDTTRDDRGEYSVKATNKLGEDNASFLVTVTGRPAAPSKATVTMTLGRTVSLSWQEPADDGGCKIGTYIVEYYRIGWEVWLKAATSRQTTTTLTELIEGSEYKFRVKAENPYGISDPSEESDVIFVPDLKRGITAPILPGKSQSHREINRSRGEKREVSFADTPQRSRSLTREEVSMRDIENGRYLDLVDRSVSAQRLAALSGRPSRADSRVTFAPETMVLDTSEPPVPPARTRDHLHGKHNQHNNQLGNHGNSFSRSFSPEATNIEQDYSRARERAMSPIVTISPPMTDEDSNRRSIYRDSRSRSVSVSRERSLSPLSMPRIHEHRDEEDSISHLRPSMNLVLKKQQAMHDDSSDFLSAKRGLTREDSLGSPREDDEIIALHGSSEFMLVLYPENQNQSDKVERSESINEGGRILAGKRQSATEEIEDEEDLIPPPMSLSLPELFSPNHQVVEILREAVSSTELLHERSMERFYRAVAAEEASKTAKRKSLLERTIGELASTRQEEDARIRKDQTKEGESNTGSLEQRGSLRRRLSNSGATSQNLLASWQAKKNRRRLSEGQAEISQKASSLLVPILLSDVEARSDPNLPEELDNNVTEQWRRSNDEEAVERLRRWHEANVPLVEANESEKSIPWNAPRNEETVLTAQRVAVREAQQVHKEESKDAKEKEQEEELESVETSEESSEELSSADSEDLKQLKSRILARQILDEEDTYHPRGRPTPHVQTTDLPSVPVAPISPTNIVPKSILKKRPENPVPVNSFGRPIPPEKPIRKIFPQPREEDQDTTLNEQIMMNETMKPGIMSESDTDSILNAAEAAKSRRIQSRMRSMTPEVENEEADVEARMAMVNHYTEIVREHSVHQIPRGHEERRGSGAISPSPRRSSISDDREQRSRVKPEQAEEQPAIRMNLRKDTPEVQRSKVKDRNKNVGHDKSMDQKPGFKKSSTAGSRGNTPARDTKEAPKEMRRSRATSRNRSPASTSRNVSEDRGTVATRSSSKTRRRTPSQDRSNKARTPSEENHFVKEKSTEPSSGSTKSSSRPNSRPSSKPSSRSSSRSNSRDRHRATTPAETKMERLQKALESKRYRPLRRGSGIDRDYPEELRPAQINDHQLAADARKTVRSTVSYIIDVTLLVAAAYVYLFKKEILAIPFIALLLYRRIHEEIQARILRRWLRFGRRQ